MKDIFFEKAVRTAFVVAAVVAAVVVAVLAGSAAYVAYSIWGYLT